MGLVHNRITDWDARRDEFQYVLLKTMCTSSFWAKFKKSKLKKALELKKEKKISARRRELLERGTNINFFFTDFFDLRHGLRRKRETVVIAGYTK